MRTGWRLIRSASSRTSHRSSAGVHRANAGPSRRRFFPAIGPEPLSWRHPTCCGGCMGADPERQLRERRSRLVPRRTTVLTMQNRLCDMFGIEFPIFAFTHCRDVAAAVSRAGGMGVLGALAFSPDQLELELKWIDEHVKVAALIGRVPQAERDVQNGVDIIIAQGYEAGGHTGDIASMVLVPDVVDAVAPTPVLGAGGIGTGRQMAAAMALGAEGVWTGSIWLTVAESDSTPAIMDKLLAAS